MIKICMVGLVLEHLSKTVSESASKGLGMAAPLPVRAGCTL